VVAVDDTGVVRFINTSAEKLLGRPAANCMRQDFRTMLCNPGTQADPLDRPVLSPATLMDWVRRGAPEEALVELSRNEGSPVRVALSGGRLGGGTEGPTYLLLRELGEEYQRVGKDRSRTRQELLRSVWDSTAVAGSEPLDAILAASRLLTAEAKQSSRRDAMLPRVTAVRQHAGSLEAYVRTVRWLNMALWGEFPRQIPTEFQAVEPVRSILDQLSPRLTGRNITTSVSDKGGWMTGDEEWVRTALLGVLNYAAESAQGGTLGIQIRRLPALVGSTEERVEFTVLDAGPALSETQLNDILSPFGDLHTPGYLSDNAAGFLPGLVLAGKLTQQMGGQIDFGSTPGGGLSVRLELPTRVVAGVLEPAPDTLEAGPIEELVCGWRLGVA
jgi:signal transduction histidine kinase